MSKLEDVDLIFSILHNGEIVTTNGDLSLLDLKIECQYLAELINKNYSYFILRLKKISVLKLELWNSLSETKILKTIQEIFDFELEISSSEIQKDCICISCYIDDENIKGGNLFLNCESIEIFDQENNIVNLAQLKEIGERYWHNCQ